MGRDRKVSRLDSKGESVLTSTPQAQSQEVLLPERYLFPSLTILFLRRRLRPTFFSAGRNVRTRIRSGVFGSLNAPDRQCYRRKQTSTKNANLCTRQKKQRIWTDKLCSPDKDKPDCQHTSHTKPMQFVLYVLFPSTHLQDRGTPQPRLTLHLRAAEQGHQLKRQTSRGPARSFFLHYIASDWSQQRAAVVGAAGSG